MMTDSGEDVRVVRRIQGTPERIWDAWTNQTQLAQWWWPKRFHTQFQLDFRPGGSYRFWTHDIPEIGTLDVRGRFIEVHPCEGLVYTWRWQDAGAQETTVTVQFVQVGDDTEVRLGHIGWKTDIDRVNHTRGWNDCLDRLERLQAHGAGTTSGAD